MKEKSFEAIKQLYPDSSEYCVSENFYEAGVKFDLITRDMKIYVLNGGCSFKSKNEVFYIFSKGLVGDLPSGRYEFSSDKNSGVRYVSIVNIAKLLSK
jgi:hypothetical protein